jgi:hypothetical protein
MDKLGLGRLEQIDLRSAWNNESTDFTPWLAEQENLELLGKAIGLELELEAREKYVGPFRADILCKDIGSGSWVLVENQLEQTDHSHLGQLLTYAAGLQAVTIVWIAARFTDEHRAALDWLNAVTSETINIFGLEIELWRIGNSAMAPKFNVVSKPMRTTLPPFVRRHLTLLTGKDFLLTGSMMELKGFSILSRLSLSGGIIQGWRSTFLRWITSFP